MNENFSLFASPPPRVDLSSSLVSKLLSVGEFEVDSAPRSAGFGRSVVSLVGALLVAMALFFAASRADAQEGRVMRDEGIRYIKLAGTYREAQDYDLALKYANKGLQMVANQGSQYWQAAGYEALGLIYRDMGDKRTALDNLYRASDIYGRIIKQRDGSPNAVSMLIQDVEQSPEVTNSNLTALRDENQRSQELNRQLNERLNALDSRIRQIDSKGAGAANGSNANVAATRRDAQPFYRDDTPSNVRPQGGVAQYGVDKKPTSQPPSARVATDTAKAIQRLPIVSIKLGAGTGYGLNVTTLTFSYLLASLSVDIFLSDQFSVGLLGAYLFNLNTAAPIVPTYQLVDLRLAYHPVRTNMADLYLGLSGGVHWPSQALQWHGGLLLGLQVNFVPAVGLFAEGTLGAVNNVYQVPTETGSATRAVIGFGGHARLGLAFNF